MLAIPTLYITFFCLAAFLLFLVIALFDAKCLRKNDYLLPMNIVTASFEILDFILDVIFAVLLLLKCYGDPQVDIFIATLLSFVFIVIPITFSIYQLVRKGKKSWFKNDDLRGWLLDHSWKLLALSIITGSSYAAIELVNCGAFGLQIFNMGLNKQQRIKYNIKRIIGVVCLEVK